VRKKAGKRREKRKEKGKEKKKRKRGNSSILEIFRKTKR
jgi:hypothetical protein